MSLYGHVRGVKQITLGSDLGSDVTLGATSVVLDDTLDFEEPQTGYPLILNMVEPDSPLEPADGDINLLGYTALDEDTNTLTLANPTETTYAAGGRVEVYPRVTLRYARVALDDAEEEATGVRALVPHSLYDRLPLGPRETIQEAVEVEDTDSEYVVSNVRGKEPEMDGAFLLDKSVDGGSKVSVAALSALAIDAGRLTAGALIGLLIATDDDPTKARVAMKDVSGENDRFKVYGAGGDLIGTLRADTGDLFLEPVPSARVALERVTVREGSVRVMGDETWQGANYGLFVEDAVLLGTPNTTGSHTDLGDNAGNVPGAPPTGRARLFYQVRSGSPNRLAVVFPNGNVKQVADDS